MLNVLLKYSCGIFYSEVEEYVLSCISTIKLCLRRTLVLPVILLYDG